MFLKLVSCLVLIFLIISFAGCGNPETPAAPATAVVPAAPETPQLAEPIDPWDIVDITMVYMVAGGRPVPSGIDEVFEAINEITGQEIGVHVTPMIMEAGVYTAQVNLMLTAREPIDLLQTVTAGAMSFTVAAPQGHFMPLDDLLATYGQGIVETLGPLIHATNIGGRTFGLSGYRSLVSNIYMAMRLDVLEELDILELAQNIRSIDDLTAIYEIVATETNLVPVVGDQNAIILAIHGTVFDDVFDNWESFDNLGDTLQLIRVAEDGTVINHFASSEFRRSVEVVRDWYERGFVYRDLAIASDHPASFLRNDVGFSYFFGTEIGGEIVHQNLAGMPLHFIRISSGPQVTTGNARSFTWTIPSASREPEAAMKFLNLMYTDERIANLLAFGLEGRDYVIGPDGMADFPEGLDASTVPYHIHDFIFGNQFLKHPWAGTLPDLRQRAHLEMQAIGASQFLGFSADLEPIQHEVMAVQGVLDQFRRQIVSGSAPMAVFEEFLQRLEQVGASDIVAEYQRQLDEWLAQR